MTFTFNTTQAMAMIMLFFLLGAMFGVYWERHQSGTKEEIEILEDEVESLQTEILKAEKDKDFLRELLYDATHHPAISHLVADRRKTRGLKPIK